jgi:hypothetical protein
LKTLKRAILASQSPGIRGMSVYIGGFYVALIEIRRRGADPHGAVRSTASTVRELNDPKINCFDQFGCNMIGMNTARYTST